MRQPVLESVVARYPGKLVATLAVDAMRSLACPPEGGEPAVRVAELETVRDRCTNPIAIAQLNLALGGLYWSELRDNERARAVLSEVAGRGPVVLEQRAQAALEAMSGTETP